MDQTDQYRETAETSSMIQAAMERVYFAPVPVLGDTLPQGKTAFLRPKWGCFLPCLSDDPR